jgi:hypothetical protein
MVVEWGSTLDPNAAKLNQQIVAAAKATKRKWSFGNPYPIKFFRKVWNFLKYDVYLRIKFAEKENYRKLMATEYKGPHRFRRYYEYDFIQSCRRKSYPFRNM